MFKNKKDNPFTFFYPTTKIKKYFLQWFDVFDAALFNVSHVNALFEMACKIFPTVTSFLPLFTTMRYGSNSLVFLLSLYYHSESTPFKINDYAEETIQKASEVIILIEEIITSDSQLLAEGGFESHVLQKDFCISMSHEMRQDVSSLPDKKNANPRLHQLRSGLDIVATLTSLFVFAPLSPYMLSVPILILAYCSYQKYTTEQEADKKTQFLKMKLEMLMIKLNELEKRLGSIDELTDLFSYAEKMLQRSIMLDEVTIPDKKLVNPQPLQFFKSRFFQYLSSLLNGLTTGVGIKNFSLLFSNDGLYIKYFLSTLSMMIVTYDDCLRQEHTRHFFNKITDFSNIIVEIQNKKLNLASAILFCQKEYLKTPNEQKIGEEIPILNDEEDILVSSKKFI